MQNHSQIPFHINHRSGWFFKINPSANCVAHSSRYTTRKKQIHFHLWLQSYQHNNAHTCTHVHTNTPIGCQGGSYCTYCPWPFKELVYALHPLWQTLKPLLWQVNIQCLAIHKGPAQTIIQAWLPGKTGGRHVIVKVRGWVLHMYMYVHLHVHDMNTLGIVEIIPTACVLTCICKRGAILWTFT